MRSRRPRRASAVAAQDLGSTLRGGGAYLARGRSQAGATRSSAKAARSSPRDSPSAPPHSSQAAAVARWRPHDSPAAPAASARRHTECSAAPTRHGRPALQHAPAWRGLTISCRGGHLIRIWLTRYQISVSRFPRCHRLPEQRELSQVFEVGQGVRARALDDSAANNQVHRAARWLKRFPSRVRTQAPPGRRSGWPARRRTRRTARLRGTTGLVARSAWQPPAPARSTS
mmetsp:Transcript_16927/g.55156  ORF Transcript_16927/g.55156 Transcript_16927/m.55156 type:complete len:229 (+) Transcript_16927:259-945(+)